MESFKIENLSFAYPGRDNKVLENINITINQGEFVLICGKSGCGKTTLLRLMKPDLAPRGEISGIVYFNGKPLTECHLKEQTSGIGFVMQNPDNQIVTDKVWHELAFGGESLGLKQNEIRTRVAEMASFFGIQSWFHKNVSELSGGQKQLLNLASVMVINPSVLILDEPTSQLDPISADEFLSVLKKINRELGVTVILTEHRLEEAFPLADRVVVLDNGKVISDETPRNTGKILKDNNHDMYRALPTPAKVYYAVENLSKCPLTVREGRDWLEEFSHNNSLNTQVIPKEESKKFGDAVIEIKDVFFRYEKNLPDVLKGFSLKVRRGELFCLMGGNGTGKTTALSLVAGLGRPYRGEVLIEGKKISEIDNLYRGLLGVLPQNPQSVFVKKTVYLDLLEILSEKKLTKEEKEKMVWDVSELCRIENLLDSHPYDLSGGEQQRAALAKILLADPEILLLDEPTKGMDAQFKDEFADILSELKEKGVTVLMVSHDIEFCAEYADRCGLVFDGVLTSVDTPGEFFKGKNFYTTAANRMARNCLPHAVLAEDIIFACAGKIEKRKRKILNTPPSEIKREISPKKEKTQKLRKKRIVAGSVFAILFVATAIISYLGLYPLSILTIAEFAAMCLCFFTQRDIGAEASQRPKIQKKPTTKPLWAVLIMLVLIPLTIYFGMFFLNGRRYYFTSLLIIIETMIPFCMLFESRKPKAREIVVISVLCAIAVAGRAAFLMVPQFKPVIAIVIIAGVAFGGETGFLVGAVSGFVSNFFFGQGPWTPWQMFTLGIIGFMAGVLFKPGLLRRTKASLCVFGFVATVVIYGGIMNPASVIMWQTNITLEMLLATYATGITLDLIHALSTAFFLWFISAPMLEKLERIKIKYGLVER